MKDLVQISSGSRKKPILGDIFTFSFDNITFWYGMVVNPNANAIGAPGAVLIYIYNVNSKDKKFIPELSKNNLLIPPTFVNNLGWSRGYFETVGNISNPDIFKIHLFEDLVTNTKRYFDENRNLLYENHPPKLENMVIGVAGLGNYLVVGDEVADKLGIA